MSIHRTYGLIEFHCDAKHCSEFIETETEHFPDAMEQFKHEGWDVLRIDGNYLHICPDCKKGETSGLSLS